MTKLLQLIKWEYLIQNRINNLTKYLFIFFLFCLISTALINNQENIQKFGIIFSVIFLPIALISFSQIIFKNDIEDGNLELLLSNFTENEIIISKFLAILLIAISSVMFNMPIIYILFDIKAEIIFLIAVTVILLLILASALLILIGSIQSYFRSNTNLLSILIMPILIPSIIFTGLIIQNHGNTNYIFVMVGINIIFLPIILYLSSYLIKNIYNI
ncbi:MAG: heme exporter protein CcmB [Rickettsia endosymbiont of Bryobia graminum]|nr:heme exporter protein CcmB [Rickettsia endosymbiont of Bryobia graminum]